MRAGLKVQPLLIIAAICSMIIGVSSASAEDRSVVHFRAPINSATVDQAISLLAPETRTFSIMSQGGDMREAIRLAWAIKEHNLRVEVDRYCLSACANYVLAASSEPVVLPPGAIVGFHTAIRTMNIAARSISSDTADRIYGSNVPKEEAFLRATGINPAFFDLALRKIEPICVSVSQGGDRAADVTLLGSKLDMYMPSIGTLRSYGFRIEGQVPVVPALVASQARAGIGTERNNLRWADDSHPAPALPAKLPPCSQAQLKGGRGG